MANIETNEVTTVTRTYTLTLSEEEAGSLLDLLRAHVAGKALTVGALRDISKALEGTEVKRVYLSNDNPTHVCPDDGVTYYRRPYAVLEKKY